MNIYNKILGKVTRIKLVNKVFGLDILKKRQIKTGPLKGVFFFGKYHDNWYFGGTFENKIIKIIEKAMLRGNIYDIGAHFGFYSLIFGRMVNDGKVYCFDPNPYCFEKLKKTIELNKIEDRVKVFNFGIGSENTEKEMTSFPENLARSTLDADFREYYEGGKKYLFEKIRVPLKTLDSLGLPKPVLIKIDVEGFELDVIKGMEGILSGVSPDLIVEIHESYKKDCHDKNEIMKILFECGYSCLHIESGKIIKESSAFSGGHIFASKNKEKIKLVQQSNK